MSDEPKKRLRAWMWWAVLALLVVYPLSLGPAGRFCAGSDSQWAFTVFRIVYAPIDLVRFLIPPVDDACSWYMNVWLPGPAP
jgi:hypothetical protein